MKRARKCCCCQPGDAAVVATSPSDVAEWDLTTFQAKRYKKYKRKCWRIEQTEKTAGFGGRTCTLATAGISKKGILLDLPDSVTLKTPMDAAYSPARLVVVCSKDCGKIGGCEQCGDPGVNGVVFKTNAGIEGDYWDLSDLIGMEVPRDANGNLYQIRGRIFDLNNQGNFVVNGFCPSAQYGMGVYFEAQTDGEGKITSFVCRSSWSVVSTINVLQTNGRYAELYYACNNNCVPSPLLDENDSYVLDVGCLGELADRYAGANGVAPPGSMWRFRLVGMSLGGRMVGAAGNMIDLTPQFASSYRGLPACIEISKFNVCRVLATSKDRLENRTIIYSKTVPLRFIERVHASGSIYHFRYEFDYDVTAEYAAAVADGVCPENFTIAFGYSNESGGRILWMGADPTCSRSPDLPSYVHYLTKDSLSGTRIFTLTCDQRSLSTNQTYPMRMCPPDLNELCPITEIRYGGSVRYVGLIE